MPESIRPSEVGTPWSINAPGFFTDGAPPGPLARRLRRRGARRLQLPCHRRPAAAAAPQAPGRPRVGASGVFKAAGNGKGGARSTVGGLRAVEQPQPAPPPRPRRRRPPAAPARAVGRAAAVPLPDVSDVYPGDDAPRSRSRPGWRASRTRLGCPPSFRSWPRSWSRACRTSATATPTRSATSRCARRSGTRASTPATARSPSSSSSGSSTTPCTRSRSASAAARRRSSRTRASGASGSPTSSGRPRSTAGATRSSWTRRASSSAGRRPARRRPQPTPRSTRPPPGPSSTPLRRRRRRSRSRRSSWARPYKWGGSTPETSFDCSGLMQWAYKEVGIEVPRVTYDQVNVGEKIAEVDKLEAGDMVFFQDSSGDMHHVGMYIGEHKFIHAPHTGDVVKVSSLDEPYYKEQFAGGRRMVAAVPEAGAPVPRRGVRPRPAAAGSGAAAPAAPGARRRAREPGASGVFAAPPRHRPRAAPRPSAPCPPSTAGRRRRRRQSSRQPVPRRRRRSAGGADRAGRCQRTWRTRTRAASSTPPSSTSTTPRARRAPRATCTPATTCSRRRAPPSARRSRGRSSRSRPQGATPARSSAAR